jgi:hypothetical protein
MKFDFSTPIGAATLREARAVLKITDRMIVTSGRIAAGLRAVAPACTDQDASSFIKDLVVAGFLALDGEKDDEATYRVTELGMRLAAAKLTKRFDRKTADAMIAALIDRAQVINNDPHIPLCVGRIRAFGSYITDAADLGDIDLTVDLIVRDGADLGDELAYGKTYGPRANTFIARMFRCQALVLQRLRARQTRLSFHMKDEIVAILPALKPIFAPHRAAIPAFVRDPAIPSDLYAGMTYSSAAIAALRQEIFG